MSRNRASFWTLDCETDPFKAGRFPFPFLFGLYNGDTGEYYEYENASDVVAFFERKRTTVYAHNGGKFDYHYLRSYINSDEPLLVINGRIAKFRIGECEFRDSLNLFPNTRLKDFGVKDEIDYTWLEPDVRAEHMPAIKKYLRQDCVGLWEVIRRYWTDYGKSLTQAGSSMRVWQKMSGVSAPRQTKAQHEEYRRFYFGGRVQCFVQGSAQTKFSVADINSAYPFGMLSAHPFSPSAIIQDHLPADGEIAKCFIELDCTSRGAFPWKSEEGEMFFPDDEGGKRNRVRRYCVTGYEFLAAIELNLISNIIIHRVHRFPLTIDFKEYIQHFFEKREEARRNKDVAGRIFGKYFMNSLYGKFGANPEKYREYVIASTDSVQEWSDKGYTIHKPWGQRYLMERAPTSDELADPSGKWRYYNVSTAASVTGYVRAHLLRGLHSCSGVLYCDTDSIAARDCTRLSMGTALGAYKNEGEFDCYHIAGKKMYAFHKQGKDLAYDGREEDEDKQTWKIACKGVNFRTIGAVVGGKRCYGPDIISRIADGGTIDFEAEVPAFSIARDMPAHNMYDDARIAGHFINRRIRNTAKDISLAPELIPA